MTRIPKTALFLGLAGIIPFLWGVVTAVNVGLSEWTIYYFGPRFVGSNVQLIYGTIILSFMSGALWGFASKSSRKPRSLNYILSVVPALWAFLIIDDNIEAATRNLIAGFLGLLMLDWYFWKQGLAPKWWVRLRFFLTVLVVLCLGIGAYF